MMRVALALLVAVVALLPGSAEAQNHAGKGNYVIIHGQVMPLGNASEFGTGLAVDWGVFQNKYIATGTRFGFSRWPVQTLEFGGGPQFHIPIGEHLMLIPALNLGYRFSTATAGLGIDLSGALTYRHDTFYVGAEVNAPVWVQGAPTFFPGQNTLNALVGFYY